MNNDYIKSNVLNKYKKKDSWGGERKKLTFGNKDLVYQIMTIID